MGPFFCSGLSAEDSSFSVVSPFSNSSASFSSPSSEELEPDEAGVAVDEDGATDEVAVEGALHDFDDVAASNPNLKRYLIYLRMICATETW